MQKSQMAVDVVSGELGKKAYSGLCSLHMSAQITALLMIASQLVKLAWSVWLTALICNVPLSAQMVSKINVVPLVTFDQQ